MDIMGKAKITQMAGAVLAALAWGIMMTPESKAAAGGEQVVSASAPDASKVTFGGNLFVDPCGTCDYSTIPSGFSVWGPNNCSSPGSVERLAVPFIAAATGVPERIYASLVLTDPARCPTNKVTLGIYTDACFPKGVGNLLVAAEATVPAAPCGLAVAKLRNAPTLAAGTKYWVAATTNSAQDSLDARWYASNNSQIAINFSDGWGQYPGNTPGFVVQGSGTLQNDIPATSHARFGSNLIIDPCTGCNYDPNSGGFQVQGPENCYSPGETVWLASPFIASATGIPRRILAAITLYNSSFCPDNKVTLSLYTDNCGLGPGTALVSGQATVPAEPCSLSAARLRSARPLTKGMKYWVVATTSAGQAGLTALWYASNDAQFAADLGIGWEQFNTGASAFAVE